MSLNGTPSDGFSYTDQIPPHQNGAHTRRLQATLQITIVKVIFDSLKDHILVSVLVLGAVLQDSTEQRQFTDCFCQF